MYFNNDKDIYIFMNVMMQRKNLFFRSLKTFLSRSLLAALEVAVCMVALLTLIYANIDYNNT